MKVIHIFNNGLIKLIDGSNSRTINTSVRNLISYQDVINEIGSKIPVIDIDRQPFEGEIPMAGETPIEGVEYDFNDSVAVDLRDELEKLVIRDGDSLANMDAPSGDTAVERDRDLIKDGDALNPTPISSRLRFRSINIFVGSHVQVVVSPKELLNNSLKIASLNELSVKDSLLNNIGLNRINYSDLDSSVINSFIDEIENVDLVANPDFPERIN